MKGYKFVLWNNCTNNAEKIEENKIVSYNDLENAQGMYDQEDFPGIYFCQTLEELSFWLYEELNWNCVDGLEIIEVETIGPVKEKVCPQAENRTVFVAEAIKGKIVPDDMLPSNLINMIESYFA